MERSRLSEISSPLKVLQVQLEQQKVEPQSGVVPDVEVLVGVVLAAAVVVMVVDWAKQSSNVSPDGALDWNFWHIGNYIYHIEKVSHRYE